MVRGRAHSCANSAENSPSRLIVLMRVKHPVLQRLFEPPHGFSGARPQPPQLPGSAGHGPRFVAEVPDHSLCPAPEAQNGSGSESLLYWLRRSEPSGPFLSLPCSPPRSCLYRPFYDFSPQMLCSTRGPCCSGFARSSRSSEGPPMGTHTCRRYTFLALQPGTIPVVNVSRLVSQLD